MAVSCDICGSFCPRDPSTSCVCNRARAVTSLSVESLPTNFRRVSFVLGDRVASTSSPSSIWTMKVSFGYDPVSGAAKVGQRGLYTEVEVRT